jgi:hypothetical protein
LVNLKVCGGKCKDIDILVFGSFDPPIKRQNIPCRTNGKPGDETLKYRDLEVTSFCTILEAKSHSASGIRFRGPLAEVVYDGEWHNATDQSDQQNIALRNFFEDTLDWTPSSICCEPHSVYILGARKPKGAQKPQFLACDIFL